MVCTYHTYIYIYVSVFSFNKSHGHGSITGSGSMSKVSNTFASFSNKFSGGASGSPNNSLEAQRNRDAKMANFAALTNLEDYLHIDTYIDDSDPHLLGCNDRSSIGIVKVRGIVLSKHTGLPLSSSYTYSDGDGVAKVYAGGYPMSMDKLLSACMQIGVCPVHRVGKIYPESNIPGITLSSKKSVGSESSGKDSSGSKSETEGNGGTSFAGGVARNKDAESSGAGSTSSSSADVDHIMHGLCASIQGSGAYAEFLRSDFPACALSEELQDWSHCTPKDRQNHVFEELGNGRFSVAIAGDPCVWIFNRMSEAHGRMVQSGTSSTTTKGSGTSQHTTMPRSNVVYLAEIHYYLKLDTGLPLFMPMPRHLYGELSKSNKGCSILTTGNSTI